jgi:formylglycine-generating enzyme
MKYLLFVLVLSGCEAQASVRTLQENTFAEELNNVQGSEVPDNTCPSNMIHIQGDYCPTVKQDCLRWLDPEHTDRNGNPAPNMCAEFRFPSTCTSTQKVPMSFCVDKYEWPNKPYELPEARMSWVEAKSNCEAIGKRLCEAEEFTMACEGPEMKPYPYGDGYHRDSTACNTENTWIDPWANPFEAVDKRAPSGSYPKCHSDWGIFDIVGNADEWVVNSQGSAHHAPWISGLMGGHWVRGVRNRCRAMTDSHDPNFRFYVTSARCCKSLE